MTDSGFYVYFWSVLIFKWTVYKADTCHAPMVSTLEKSTRWVQPKILVLIINFFSLNFTRTEIELERVSSSQNERILGGKKEGGGARKGTRANKGGGRRVIKTHEFWVNVLFECPSIENIWSLSNFTVKNHCVILVSFC